MFFIIDVLEIVSVAVNSRFYKLRNGTWDRHDTYIRGEGGVHMAVTGRFKDFLTANI